MVDRDVRRPRRIVRHAAVPRPADSASTSTTGTPAGPAAAPNGSQATVPIPTPGSPSATETVPSETARADEAPQADEPQPAHETQPANETDEAQPISGTGPASEPAPAKVARRLKLPVPVTDPPPAPGPEAAPAPGAEPAGPTGPDRPVGRNAPGARIPPAPAPGGKASPDGEAPSDPDAEGSEGSEEDGEELPPLGTMVLPERPEGFPTAATLAEQDAAAVELRRELEQLRRRLDERPPPLAPARKRNRSPLLGVLVVGGTLGVIATATLVPWSDLDLPGHHGAGTTSTAQQSKSRPNQAQPGQPGQVRIGADQNAGSTTARPLGVPALAPLPAPTGSLPRSGPGISRPGTMMVVQIGSDGALTVVEQAMLGPRGLRAIDLTLPSMSTLGGAVADLNPTVRNLRVSINGTAVNATPTADGTGWSVVAPDQRARMIRLSYRITDAVVLSKPSDAGRALAVSLPLLGQALREQGLPLVVKTLGSQVGGVSCPGAPAAEVLCGMPTTDGWIATVPASATSPLLLLQLNLKN